MFPLLHHLSHMFSDARCMRSSFGYLKLISLWERERGQLQASRVAARISGRIPDGVSDEVKLACAIEAFEREDYVAWPEHWFMKNILPDLLDAFGNKKPTDDITSPQRARYEKLYIDDPELLATVAQGFTRKLNMSDRQGFVDELVRAGRRQCERGDEETALDEDRVLHVAMSYKHADRYDGRGTIDYETANEMYDIVLAIPLVTTKTKVRIWIDQNLHRYDDKNNDGGEWFKRGLLPYAVNKVACALSSYDGLGLGRRRPWIWVETGLALSSLGIYCRKETIETLDRVIVDPSEGLLPRYLDEGHCQILGIGHALHESVREALRNISLWTPGMLEHRNYEYAEYFSHFVQWAKAQTVRLNHLKDTNTLSLTGDTFEPTPLEDVAWIQSLPSSGIQMSKQKLNPPYLRLEMAAESSNRIVSLFRACAQCVERNGIVHMIRGTSALDIFCFEQSANSTRFNVNPPSREIRIRQEESESNVYLHDFEAMKKWQGGYCLWDRRFGGTGRPKLTLCCRIFDRWLGMRRMLGAEGEVISVGGFVFQGSSFMLSGLRMERVYTSWVSGEEIILAESDILCLRELGTDLEREFVLGLTRARRTGSISRILKVEEGTDTVIDSPHCVGAHLEEILSVRTRLRQQESLGPKEVIIRRSRLTVDLFQVYVLDDDWGHAFYTFRTTRNIEERNDRAMTRDLVGFRTGGDIENTMKKIRLMMGSEEFSSFSQEGLSLGIGRRDGTSGRYPGRFRLEGSEFSFCQRCQNVYSPVNGLIAFLCCTMPTRVMIVEWGNKHKCVTTVDCCMFRGDVA